MASKNSSFDITSETDLAEVQNACNQTMLEIRQRFDFKGSKSQVEIDMKTAEIKILADDAHKLNSVIDIIQGKLELLIKRTLHNFKSLIKCESFKNCLFILFTTFIV